LDLIKQQYDATSAGHLGCDKTIAKVSQLGYWVGMLQDIEKYCRECIVCQCTMCPQHQSKPPNFYAHWKTLANGHLDILEVPISRHNNHYLLVTQDYMTKWADAIPTPNQITS